MTARDWREEVAGQRCGAYAEGGADRRVAGCAERVGGAPRWGRRLAVQLRSPRRVPPLEVAPTSLPVIESDIA